MKLIYLFSIPLILFSSCGTDANAQKTQSEPEKTNATEVEIETTEIISTETQEKNETQEKKVIECSNINYHKRMSHTEIAHYVKKSHIGLSFRNDGIINTTAIPVKILEYIGAGLPIVATPRSEVGDLMCTSKNFYEFDNTELNSIVDTIIAIKNEYNKGIFEPEVYMQFSRKQLANKFKLFTKKTLENK